MSVATAVVESPAPNSTTLMAVRSYLPGDRAFILATWLRGLYYGETYYSEIPKDVFMHHYHGILERYLTGQAEIKVCCLKDDPEVILGYSVSHYVMSPDNTVQGVLDFVFVKKAWRQVGIAKTLLPGNLSYVTHMTKLGKALKPSKVTYNPFI